MSWITLALTAWAIFTLAYGVARLTEDYSVVDIFWGLAFVAMAHVFIASYPAHFMAKWMYLLIALWGIRLSIHILSRKLAWPGEDFRYKAMHQNWKNATRPYVTVFMFQAFLAIVILLPFIVLTMDENASGLSLLGLLGSVIALLGFALEAVSDYQLLIFKKEHTNNPKVRCEKGMWALCRHPNYLGEITFWTGLAIMALPAQYGWYALISPVILGILLTRVTGIPLIEQHMDGYETKGNKIPLLIPNLKDLINMCKQCCHRTKK